MLVSVIVTTRNEETKWEIGNGRWEIGNGKWKREMGNRKWEIVALYIPERIIGKG